MRIASRAALAADKPYLRPRVPDAPETRAINFDPNADWPL
jgi:hypothetical protein